MKALMSEKMGKLSFRICLQVAMRADWCRGWSGPFETSRFHCRQKLYRVRHLVRLLTGRAFPYILYTDLANVPKATNRIGRYKYKYQNG